MARKFYSIEQLLAMALKNEEVDESGDASFTSFFEEALGQFQGQDNGLEQFKRQNVKTALRWILTAYLEWALGTGWDDDTNTQDDVVLVKSVLQEE